MGTVSRLSPYPDGVENVIFRWAYNLAWNGVSLSAGWNTVWVAPEFVPPIDTEVDGDTVTVIVETSGTVGVTEPTAPQCTSSPKKTRTIARSNIHGTNRLGSNAVVDCVSHGYIAGQYAVTGTLSEFVPER